jgi:hypothetical protein
VESVSPSNWNRPVTAVVVSDVPPRTSLALPERASVSVDVLSFVTVLPNLSRSWSVAENGAAAATVVGTDVNVSDLAGPAVTMKLDVVTGARAASELVNVSV